MTHRRNHAEDGFMLVGLIAAIFIILLIVAIAAPRVAKSLRRDQEVEAIHRGNQYVRAIQLYYRKLGHYPSNIDQLEKTNNIRFLRQRYVDPMTGKPDWRLIHLGEAKTTVKGFFGKPLLGLANGAGIAGAYTPGTAAGATGSAPGGSSGSAQGSFGSSSSFGGSGNGSSSFGGSGNGSSSFGGSAPSGSSFGGSTTDPSATQTGSTTGIGPTGTGTPGAGANTSVGASTGTQSASTFSGGGAPIVGISSVASGNSITVLNEQKTYVTWEFLYDPRIEQLKAKTSLLGGSIGGTSASSFGSSTGFGSGSGSNSSGSGTGGAATPGSSIGSPGSSGGSGSTTPSAPPTGTGPPPQ